jgi:hypothetical protein
MKTDIDILYSSTVLFMCSVINLSGLYSFYDSLNTYSNLILAFSLISRGVTKGIGMNKVDRVQHMVSN